MHRVSWFLFLAFSELPRTTPTSKVPYLSRPLATEHVVPCKTRCVIVPRVISYAALFRTHIPKKTAALFICNSTQTQQHADDVRKEHSFGIRVVLPTMFMGPFSGILT